MYRKDGKWHSALKVWLVVLSQPWRKILYLEQDYPDNFTPDSFLDCMTVNRDLKTRTLWSIIISALWIADEIILCVSFFSIFELQFSGVLKHELLLSITIGMIPLGTSQFFKTKCSKWLRIFVLIHSWDYDVIQRIYCPCLCSATDCDSFHSRTWFLNAVMVRRHALLHFSSSRNCTLHRPPVTWNHTMLSQNNPPTENIEHFLKSMFRIFFMARYQMFLGCVSWTL